MLNRTDQSTSDIIQEIVHPAVPFLGQKDAQLCTSAGNTETGDPKVGDGRVWVITPGNNMPIAVHNAYAADDMVGHWVWIAEERYSHEIYVTGVNWVKNLQKGGSLYAAHAAAGPQQSPDTMRPRHNYTAIIAPTVNDDSSDGYSTNSLWVNTSTDIAYICVDATAGAAVWKRFSGMAPADATYITQTANSELTAEQALGALATGLLKNTTTTGILSIAADGTDYLLNLGGLTEEKAIDPLLDSFPFRDNSANANRRIELIDLEQAYYAQSNLAINGGMQIWQRRLSTAAPATGIYHADQWLWHFVGAGVATVGQSTNVPTVAENAAYTQYSFEIDVTTADASIAASDLYFVEQRIEGYNIRSLVGRSIAVSFWIMSTVTGIHCAVFRNAGFDRGQVKEFTINTTNTWEYKTLIFSPPPSSGTWDYNAGTGLRFGIVLAAGSNFHVSADDSDWTPVGLATSNQVNSMSSTSNFFRVYGLDIHPGQIAYPFMPRSFHEEFRLCQRYYWKSYPHAVLPGAVQDNDFGFDVAQLTNLLTNNTLHLPSEMRATPTVTIYSSVTGTAGQVRNRTTAADVGTGALVASNFTNRAIPFLFDSGNPFVAGSVYSWHLTAEAGLT